MPIRFNDFEVVLSCFEEYPNGNKLLKILFLQMFVLQVEGVGVFKLYEHVGLAHRQLIGRLFLIDFCQFLFIYGPFFRNFLFIYGPFSGKLINTC
jgi:hypothetical protein